jgi:hypothetical protein
MTIAVQMALPLLYYCLLWESYEAHKHILWAKCNAKLPLVKVGGTYIYQLYLNGYND